MNINTTKAQAIRFATIEALADCIDHYYHMRKFNTKWFDGLRHSTVRTYESQCERLMCEFAGVPMKNGVIPEFVLMHKFFTYDEIQIIFSAFDYGHVTGLQIINNKITYTPPSWEIFFEGKE